MCVILNCNLADKSDEVLKEWFYWLKMINSFDFLYVADVDIFEEIESDQDCLESSAGESNELYKALETDSDYVLLHKEAVWISVVDLEIMADYLPCCLTTVITKENRAALVLLVQKIDKQKKRY